jgi:hypothetical protein
VGDVDPTLQHRLNQPLHLARQVLAVGVESHHDLRSRLGEQPVSGSQRRATAAVDHVAGDDRAMLGCGVAGAVARSVVDDEHRGFASADLFRNPVEHVTYALGLVVGGDQHRDLAAEALRQPGVSELLPGQSLEHG